MSTLKDSFHVREGRGEGPEWDVEVYDDNGRFHTQFTHEDGDMTFIAWNTRVQHEQLAIAFVDVYRRALNTGKEIGHEERKNIIQRELGLT